MAVDFILMKKIFLYIIVLWLGVNCRQPPQSQNDKNNSVDLQKYICRNKQIETIREFYLTFYGSESDITNYQLRSKYISERILNRIDSLSVESNLVLDYDPFIQGQDWDIEEFVKTLEIKPLKKENEFRVSFYLFDKELGGLTYVDLLLKKKSQGGYLIYSILNDDYLNFKNEYRSNDLRAGGVQLDSDNKDKYSLLNYSNNYIVYTFDINGDEVDDKVVSSKPYQGNELLIFLGENNNELKLSLETINFSQDGGNILKNITPQKDNNGFILTTYFPDRGYYEEVYDIRFNNKTWTLETITYKTSSSLSEDKVAYICEVAQNINLNDSNLTGKIKSIPEESERDKKCIVVGKVN